MARREPIKWPDNARIAVIIAVPFETWPEDIRMRNSLNMSNRRPYPPNAQSKKDLHVISDRQYGERVGVYRMLDLLRRHGIETTFFANGITVEEFPDTAKEILAGGHEIASENYIHDYSFMKSYEEEKPASAVRSRPLRKWWGNGHWVTSPPASSHRRTLL